MKLIRSLTVAGVYAGWPDKFENIKVKNESSRRLFWYETVTQFVGF